MRPGPGHDRKLPRPGLLPTSRPVVVAICAGLCVVVLTAALAEIVPRVFRGHTGSAWWGVAAVVALTAGWVGLRRVRVEQRVVRLKFRLCTECGYSLHDAAQEGRCPECGVPYELDRTIRSWQTWLDR